MICDGRIYCDKACDTYIEDHREARGRGWRITRDFHMCAGCYAQASAKLKGLSTDEWNLIIGARGDMQGGR